MSRFEILRPRRLRFVPIFTILLQITFVALFSQPCFAGAINAKWCMESVPPYWWSDVRIITPTLEIEAPGTIPDGTYSVSCSGVDEEGWSVFTTKGGGGTYAAYTWTVTATVQGGAVINVETQSTWPFNGSRGYMPGTAEYPKGWQWTQSEASFSFPPGSDVEAVVAPLYVPIIDGEGCGVPSYAVLQQGVKLRIKCGTDTCDIGNCSTADSPGKLQTRAASLHVEIGLGERYDQRGSGSLSIDAMRPGRRLSKRASVRVPEGFLSRINNNGVFSYNAALVVEGAQVAAHLYPEDMHRYRIDFYDRDALDWNAGPGCTFSGPPNKTIIVENPDAPADRSQPATVYHRLRVSDGAVDRIFAWDDVTGIWALTDGAGLLLETATESYGADTTEHTHIRETYHADGSTASYESVRYQRAIVDQAPNGGNPVDVWRYVPVETIQGEGADVRTTIEEVYGPAAPIGSRGRVRFRQAPGQPWERYEYDVQGNRILTITQLGDQPSTSAASLNREVEVQSGTFSLPAQARDVPAGVTQLMGQLFIERELGIEVGRRYRLVHDGPRPGPYGGSLHRVFEIRCLTPGAASTAVENLVTTTREETTYRDYYGGGSIYPPMEGYSYKATFTFPPDGTMAFDYADRVINMPGWNDSTLSAGSGHGAPAADLRTLLSGERRVRALDTHGRWSTETTYSEPGAVLLETASVAERDFYDRPSRITYSDGTEWSVVAGACCGPTAETDRAGVVTRFTYDSQGRRDSETRDGVRTRTVFDGGGRARFLYRGPVDAAGTLTGAEQLVSQNVYDTGGKLIETRDAANRVTTIIDTIDAAGVRKVQRTYPGGGIETEIYNPDGTLQALGDVGDTAVHPRKYEYGLAENLALPGGGVTNARFTKEIRIREGGAETEWTKTYTDMLGRTCRVETAHGGAAHPATYEYDAAGQLVKVTDPDGVITLHAYNAEGEREVDALDMNRNGAIDYAGADRIVKHARSVAQRAGNTVVRRETTSQWLQEGADAPTVVSEIDRTPNGLQVWSTAHGLLTERHTTQTGGASTTTTIFPDLSTLVETADHARPTSRVRKDTAAVTIDQQTYAYADPFKRLTSVTDLRNGATDFTYYADDQIETVTSPDPDGAGPLARLVTTTYYDDAGRKQREVQPDGGEVLSDYWPTGELKSTSGARTYPVSYTYDPQGRLKTLTTRQGAPGAGEAVTTWNYSPAGLLSGKQYHDGTGPTYTYSWAGRLSTRQWARGITTTYAPNNAGEVASIAYSDGLTPGASFSYDRRGLPATIADASGSHTLSHTADGQSDDESYTAGIFAGLTVDRGYDALRRRNALAVPALGAGIGTDYGYDGASRLQTVTSGQVGATYTREPSSPLLASVTFTRNAAPVMTTTRTHDFLGRQLSHATTVAGQGAPAASVGYTYNAASQRTQLTREDDSVWQYGYDALGQVTSGSRKWSDNTAVAGQQFAYSFDEIGNRQTATINGRVSTYTPNLLNQYASRTVPGAVDVQGTAQPQAVVTVNGNLTARNGSHYAGTATVDNTAAPVDATLNIVGVRNNADVSGNDAIITQTGLAFVPKTPESFTHDLDGNLTGDGRFTYTWDAENRLIAAEALPTLPATAKVKLTMSYDVQSRRIQKQVHTWNAGTSTYQLTTTLRFLYDGWNLIAELNGSNQVQRSYTWGLDLSGTLQGAGGVYGLLALTDASTGLQYLPTYDGNGNLLTLVNATDSSVAAQYEYGPFGEPLRATGAMANGNPVRFSTKYIDEETGLVYYGHRYYQPQMGRWLSRDPIAESGGINVNAFVFNDGLNYVDYVGLADINVTIVRKYLPRETIGQFSMTTDVESAKCCGSVSGYTLELPQGRYKLNPWQGKDNGVKIYPIGEGPRKGEYSPSETTSINAFTAQRNKYGGANSLPVAPFPVGTLGTNNINVLTHSSNPDSRFTGTRMHAGATCLSSRGCPIVGPKPHVEVIEISGTEPGSQPGQEGQLVRLHAFNYFDSLKKQIEIGRFIECVRKALGRSPEISVTITSK